MTETPANAAAEDDTPATEGDTVDTVDARKNKNGRLALTIVMLAWFLIVLGVILWQTIAYRGMTAAVAEWEFATFGRYFPWASLLILTAIFSLPPIYFLFRRERHESDHVVTLDELEIRGRRQLRQLTIAAVACAGATLVAFGLIWTLPRADGTPVRIDARVSAAPATGPVILSGRLRYDRVATLDRDLLLLDRSFHFVPIEPVAGARLRYFVQFDAVPVPSTTRTSYRGVLREGGLPGEVVQLFRNSGYALDAPFYVLFADPAPMRWPFYMIALQFLFTTLLLAVAALIRRRMNTKLSRRNGATLPVPDAV